MAYIPERGFYNKPTPYASARPDFGHIRKARQKYDRGETPCHYCDLGHHTDCRPRLDNTLCSCVCRYAAAHRANAEMAKAENPDMSDKDCVRQIAPKMRKRYIGDDCFHPVDRSKDDPFEEC